MRRSETRHGQRATDPKRDATAADDRIAVKVGRGGRIVIPAGFRAAMEAREGDTLVATIDGDGVVRLTSASAAVGMARRIVCEAVPADVSLSDSQIEDRRRETAPDNWAVRPIR